MSGFEVAGLALAVLPLLVSAAEHYDDCIRPILRYRKIVKDIQLFQRRLEVQQALFKNQCRIVLEGIVDHDAAVRMLAVGHDDPLWRDADLERQLNESFGECLRSWVTSIDLTSEKLQEIEKESRKLQAMIDPAQTLKRRLAKKILYCLSESPLERYIASLRDLNDDFIKISNQITFKNVLQSTSFNAPGKVHDKGLLTYKKIREASAKVYEALGKACTKHSEHLALFCIDPVDPTDELRGSDLCTQIKFKIAFSRKPLLSLDSQRSSDQEEPMWFMIDTITDDAVVVRSAYPTDVLPRLIPQTLKRELDIASAQPAKKTQKSVHFQTIDTPHRWRRPEQDHTTELVPVQQLRKDFCDLLREQSRTSNPEHACLCMLENAGNIKHRVYRPPKDKCYTSKQRKSLEELMTSTYSPLGDLSMFEKFRLAKSLAITVLRYFSTPWLASAWRSNDIFFFGTDSVADQQKTLDLSLPHINARVKDSISLTDHQNAESFPPPSRQTSFPSLSLAPNSLLFSLGIILLELAFSSSLRNLQQPCDLEDGKETRYTEFMTAKRVANTVVREMGGTYSKIVKKLLQCNFGCGDDLNDPKLQGIVHRDVVCELERLEQEFSDLRFG